MSKAPPDAWLTYHLYYKTPDWLGPIVTEALEIPYCVAEASVAPKRAIGPWSQSHQQVERALRHADLVIFPNNVDEACVMPVLRPDTEILRLPPFIKSIEHPDRETCRRALAVRYGLALDKPWLLTVAMMREGDKSASYDILSRVCRELSDQPHEHLIVGDGVQRSEIESSFLGLNTTFIGRLDGTDLHNVYAASDVFVWPAVNEAWGMVFLEAQMHGLPVVAGRSGGVENVVSNGESGYVVELDDQEAFVRGLKVLIGDSKRRDLMGQAGRRNVVDRHSFSSAAKRLNGALEAVLT